MGMRLRGVIVVFAVEEEGGRMMRMRRQERGGLWE